MKREKERERERKRQIENFEEEQNLNNKYSNF